ncbi:DEKNAAC101046 [Brettanomyces naardenensis]|uniref:DEKNAAC101046 n=1 Tax=Brettanomyces naardenensis TaxID=13370 RepID=A0A448YGY8_BRENA|nr:DEKNAAC101046 [Brettanomyces naardenensis]
MVWGETGPFRTINSFEFMRSIASIYEGTSAMKRDSSLQQNSLGDFEISLQYTYSSIGTVSDNLVGFRFSILDDSLLNNELRPWELDPSRSEAKQRHVRMWPVTDNLKGIVSFDSPTNRFRRDLIEWPATRSISDVDGERKVRSSPHLFSLLPNFLFGGNEDGDSDTLESFSPGIYYTGTRWFRMDKDVSLVPEWISAYFLPSFVGDWLTFHRNHHVGLVQVHFPLEKLSTGEAKMTRMVEDSKHIKLIVEFANENIYLESATLHFTVKFKGVRYYLFHYPTLFLFAGVTLFWTISSFICLLVSYGVFFYWRKQQQEKSEKIKQPMTIITNVETLLS